jgi:hypothetical protein
VNDIRMSVKEFLLAKTALRQSPAVIDILAATAAYAR